MGATAMYRVVASEEGEAGAARIGEIQGWFRALVRDSGLEDFRDGTASPVKVDFEIVDPQSEVGPRGGWRFYNLESDLSAPPPFSLIIQARLEWLAVKTACAEYIGEGGQPDACVAGGRGSVQVCRKRKKKKKKKSLVPIYLPGTN